MASRIETIGDFHISKKQGWHKLTTIKTPERNDFAVFRQVVCIDSETGQEILFNGGKIVIPKSSVDNAIVAMPQSSKTYTLFQPREAWDYVEACLAGTDHEIESICMLAGQSIWSVSAVLTELNKIGGSGHEYRLNFTGGMDRSFSPQAGVGVTRVVCFNTVMASRNEGKPLFKKKLTANFRIKLDEAKTDIEKACGMAAVFEATYKKACEKPCKVDEARNVYAGFITRQEQAPELSTRQFNTVETLVSLYQHGRGNKGETRADLLNGFTERFTRSTDEKVKEMSDAQVAKLVESSEIGTYAEQKSRFADLVFDESNEGRKAWKDTRDSGELVLKAYATKSVSN